MNGEREGGEGRREVKGWMEGGRCWEVLCHVTCCKHVTYVVMCCDALEVMQCDVQDTGLAKQWRRMNPVVVRAKLTLISSLDAKPDPLVPWGSWGPLKKLASEQNLLGTQPPTCLFAIVIVPVPSSLPPFQPPLSSPPFLFDLNSPAVAAVALWCSTTPALRRVYTFQSVIERRTQQKGFFFLVCPNQQS